MSADKRVPPHDQWNKIRKEINPRTPLEEGVESILINREEITKETEKKNDEFSEKRHDAELRKSKAETFVTVTAGLVLAAFGAAIVGSVIYSAARWLGRKDRGS